MKKRLLTGIFAVVMVVLFTACTTRSWTAIGMSTSAGDTSWDFTAASVNGYTSRNVDFSAESIAAINIESTNEEGAIRLSFTQGDRKEEIEVTGSYSDTVNLAQLGGFTAGSVSIRIDFEQAKGLALHLSW